MPSRARELYIALLGGAILATALILAASSGELPYGAYFFGPFVLLIGLTGVTAFALLRARCTRLALVTAELFRMDPSQMPHRAGATYVGHAFEWKPEHAEKLYRLAALGIDAPDKVKAILGGNTLLHGLGIADEKPLFVSDKKRTHHTLILGSPGEGKTRAIELMVRQLIEKGDVVVIVDPKGDSRLMNLAKQVSEETGRGDDFRLFAPPWAGKSVAYNPLSNFGTASEIADRLIGILPPSKGDGEAFRGFQWGATKAVVQGLLLASLPITIARILKGLRDMSEVVKPFVLKQFPDLADEDSFDVGDLVQNYEAAVKAKKMARSYELDDLLYHLQLDQTYYGKMVASFLPQLDRLSAGPKLELLSPEPDQTERDVLDWNSVNAKRQIIYFYLGSLHGEESANAVGKMLLLDFQSFVASRYSYGGPSSNRISLVIDEAHQMISKPFLNILAESRGANIACILSSQTTAQFEQALGSRAAVDEILTQVRMYLQFQTRNFTEAQNFSRLVGQRQLRTAGESFRYEAAFWNSGSSNVEDFRSQHHVAIQIKEADLVPTWAISELSMFHFYARIGGSILKGRVPLLTDPVCTFVEDIKEGVGDN